MERCEVGQMFRHFCAKKPNHSIGQADVSLHVLFYLFRCKVLRGVARQATVKGS